MTSPVFFDPTLQTTWKASFANDNNVVGLNLIHPEVIKLLKVNSKDELSESARKEVIESITDLNLNTVMFKNTFNEMVILHHNKKNGGGLLNPKTKHFGLFGGGTTAHSFKYKPTSILTINEVECPRAIKSPEDLEAARDANPMIRRFPNAVSLTSFLTQAIINLESPTAADMYIAALTAVEKIDDIKTDRSPSATESLKKILPYLWAAHHKMVSTVETSPHISKAVANMSASLHR